jgi:hypothetical protein
MNLNLIIEMDIITNPGIIESDLDLSSSFSPIEESSPIVYSCSQSSLDIDISIGMSSLDPWEHILNCQQIADIYNSNDIVITSKQIKECKTTWTGPVTQQFEPRLLAYQITADTRPAIFRKYGISILPVRNGQYMLTKNKIYQPLDYTYTPVEVVMLTVDTTSLLLSIGESESSLIDRLRYSGVFEREEFLNEPITHGSLLNGRHRCSFDMQLGETIYSIKGVQYEIDSCFESEHKILIIECKNTNSPFDSFNIRQLYFPYREILEKTFGKKEIICLFIHNCMNIVHIWKYWFDVPTRMDSIVLLGHYMFKFSNVNVNVNSS